MGGERPRSQPRAVSASRSPASATSAKTASRPGEVRSKVSVARAVAVVESSAQDMPDVGGDLDVDLEAILDGHDGVKAWQAELRTVGGFDELIVFLAPAGGGHPGRLVRELDAELDVVQFVVMDPYDIADRIKAARGQKVVDLRS